MVLYFNYLFYFYFLRAPSPFIYFLVVGSPKVQLPTAWLCNRNAYAPRATRTYIFRLLQAGYQMCAQRTMINKKKEKETLFSTIRNIFRKTQKYSKDNEEKENLKLFQIFQINLLLWMPHIEWVLWIVYSNQNLLFLLPNAGPFSRVCSVSLLLLLRPVSQCQKGMSCLSWLGHNCREVQPCKKER